jgi:hypothetical protein
VTACCHCEASGRGNLDTVASLNARNDHPSLKLWSGTAGGRPKMTLFLNFKL